jgi:hypothetical protein
VYCLKREQWGQATGDFDLDHFQPQARNPKLATAYDNLLYACHRCNTAKANRLIPDPCSVFTRDQVRLLPDGAIDGRSVEANLLIRTLGLNSPRIKQWRLIWIRNVELAQQYDPDQYTRLIGFPEDLPDLSQLRPPAGNSRPEGIEESYFARRRRGELPETY